MGAIGDYLSWAWSSQHGFLELLLLGLVVPAVVLLVVATVLIWILAGLKFTGRAFAGGFTKGWTRESAPTPTDRDEGA